MMGKGGQPLVVVTIMVVLWGFMMMVHAEEETQHAPACVAYAPCAAPCASVPVGQETLPAPSAPCAAMTVPCAPLASCESPPCAVSCENLCETPASACASESPPCTIPCVPCTVPCETPAPCPPTPCIPASCPPCTVPCETPAPCPPTPCIPASCPVPCATLPPCEPPPCAPPPAPPPKCLQPPCPCCVPYTVYKPQPPSVASSLSPGWVSCTPCVPECHEIEIQTQPAVDTCCTPCLEPDFMPHPVPCAIAPPPCREPLPPCPPPALDVCPCPQGQPYMKRTIRCVQLQPDRYTTTCRRRILNGGDLVIKRRHCVEGGGQCMVRRRHCTGGGEQCLVRHHCISHGGKIIVRQHCCTTTGGSNHGCFHGRVDMMSETEASVHHMVKGVQAIKQDVMILLEATKKRGIATSSRIEQRELVDLTNHAMETILLVKEDVRRLQNSHLNIEINLETVDSSLETMLTVFRTNMLTRSSSSTAHILRGQKTHDSLMAPAEGGLGAEETLCRDISCVPSTTDLERILRQLEQIDSVIKPLMAADADSNTHLNPSWMPQQPTMNAQEWSYTPSNPETPVAASSDGDMASLLEDNRPSGFMENLGTLVTSFLSFYIRQIDIPPVEGTKELGFLGDIDWKIHNIKITDLNIPPDALDVKLLTKDGFGLSVGAAGIDMGLVLEWEYDTLLLDDEGSATVKATTLKAGVSIYVKLSGGPTVTLQDVYASVDQIEVDVSDTDLDFVYNAILDIMQEKIKDMVNDSMNSMLKTHAQKLVTRVNELISSFLS